MIANGVLCLALLSAVGQSSEASRKPAAPEVVALVSALSGSASVDSGGRTTLKLFDWVRSGATVRVPRESQLTLVLTSGHRFELTGPARATVSATALSATTGSIRALSALPRLPRVAPISKAEERGRHAAAVPVRGPHISGLYPSNAAVIRGSPAVFSFDAVEGATQYLVEVEDARALRVFHIETNETRVPVSVDLQPGATYYWRVRTVGKVGAQARGDAEFRTLLTADEGARQALRDAMDKLGDPHTLALLAHIDFELGLFREAGDGVRAALEKSTADPSLHTALLQLSRRIAALGIRDGTTP